MASLGGEQNSGKDSSDSASQKGSRPSSVEKKIPVRDREEKLRIAKERQNEERQRKIEELKAQAEAAQRYREQKEEERRRRIEELRNRDNDRRHQVEERKKAIIEAEKERREYILRKNQERDARLDAKRRNERSSNVFAFGSSTPRLLDPVDLGSVSPSAFWGHRRSTSITNVAYTGAPLSRRSSERDLADGSKKRATSAGGIDRQLDDRRRRSTSMYEVFNWGYSNDEPPKRLPLSIAAAEIDIDGPPTKVVNVKYTTKEDTIDSPPISYRSVARRKTDLMPTIPSPREPSFGSKSSLQSHTPRTPGRAVSMTRLDQLAQPVRRNGEHIRAIIERERQQHYDGLLQNSHPNSSLITSPTTMKYFKSKSNNNASMSRSMTHLAGNKPISNASMQESESITSRTLRKTGKFRSMTQLSTATTTSTTTSTTSTKKIITSRYLKIGKKDDAPISLTSTGSRSGEVTPGGSINTSRPGSAMSTSTTTSVHRRPAPPTRKPRPASIAVTGVSLNDDFGKFKKEKPPLPKMQNTPKRTSLNNASTTPSKISSVDSNKQSEKKLNKKESTPQKLATNVMQQSADGKDLMNISTFKVADETGTSIEIKEKTKEQNVIVEAVAQVPVPLPPAAPESEIHQTKEEKDALNTVKTETTIPVDTIKAAEAVVPEINKEIPQNNQEVNVVEESIDEKVDNDSEKGTKKDEKEKEKETVDEIRELSVERQDNDMTASMIARKITTEEEAKAALAERRRLAREEAERQAELERQRLEAERQAELERQAEEEERQRKLEEESLRLAEEQRKAEEERLKQAIEEAKKKEEAEKLKREEEEKLRIEKEEADKKAKEEAEKQRLEIAERLKREEKEREERRKRVEAIMSRTRAKGGGNATPNSTPTKDNENGKNDTDKKSSEDKAAIESNNSSNTQSSPEISTSVQQQEQSQQQQQQQLQQKQNVEKLSYEQSVTDKENALMKTFSNMIIDENTKNIQNPLLDFTNGKILQQQNQTNDITSHTIANGNGHIENLNKNETNVLVDIPQATTITDQLIDLSNESQQQITDAVNFTNNNNSLLTSSATLVNTDSHESKEISLL